MPLAPGFKLGRHEVLAFVGAGGMGEVYRARDTELGRVVALKVLRPERASDEGARRRLIQEARTASALNHPHITTVHDVVEAGGMQCIVMEFVAGRPLSTVIRGGLDLDEALRIAIAIADGLAGAHAAGVVHRDLKPANVVISDDGVPKVLDFGIAKLVEEPAGAEAQDPTQTEDSCIVPRGPTSAFGGTPGYMAPEQITGGTVDARSDIFSFGALLYEMITGRRAFAGATVADTLGAVLALQPIAPRQLVPEVPVELEQVAMRCLRKEPERRFQSIADVKVVLQDIAEARATSPLPRRARSRGARLLGGAAASALVLGVAVGVVAVVASWSRDGGEQTPARLEALTTMPGIEGSPTFSPDGRQFAYSFDPERLKEDGRPDFDLWVRLVGGPDARRLTSDDTDDLAPSWSPDGRWIAYLRGQVGETPAVYLISPLGGVPRPVTAIRAARVETGWLRGAPASQITWAPDSRAVIFARAELGGATGGLQLARIDGSGSRPLTSTPLPVVHRDPALSPDGRHLAYSACAGVVYAPCDVYVLDLDRDQTPQPPARRLTQHDLTVVGLAWTQDGESLVFGGARFNLTHLWRVPADGSAPPARIEIGRRGLSPAIAASGDRLAFVHTVSNNDIYAFEPGQPDRVVASSTLTDQGPSYGPEGRFAFDSGRSGEGNDIWIATDGDGASAIQLTHGPGGWQGSAAWSPDGSLIAFDSRGADGVPHVWVVRPDGLDLRRVTQGAIGEAMPSWSRDSRWLYYRDDRADGSDLWRLPIAGGAPVRVTHGGGFRGVEAPDGQTLLFTVSDDESALFAQPIAGGPRRQVVACAITRSLAAGPDGVYYMACPAQAPTSKLYRLDLETATELLLGTAAIGGGFVPGMSVSPDGRRILFTKHVAEGSDLMLVEHFR